MCDAKLVLAPTVDRVSKNSLLIIMCLFAGNLCVKYSYFLSQSLCEDVNLGWLLMSAQRAELLKESGRFV